MIDVLYLARGIGNSFEEIKSFFASYHAHSAGCEHTLHILAKGFEQNPENYAKLETLSKEAGANIINLPDDGFDLMAYARAANTLSERFIFCLNTSSSIIYDNWLRHFEYYSSQNPKLGMIGAFGSWEGVPGLRVLLDNEVKPEDRSAYWKKYKHVFTSKHNYNFPNPHIRTNGVLIERQVYVDFMQNRDLKYKFECYNLESGSENLSRHFTELGYDIGIINAEGKFFQQDSWDQSYCFGIIDSNKALFRDNQIKRVEDLPMSRKTLYSFSVWGRLSYLHQHPKISIFSVYHDKPTSTMTSHKLYLSSNVYQPIFTGDSPLQHTAYTLDDKSGDNISEKNPFFGELTAHYWVWKNYLKQNPQKQYVGFAHYRRILNISTNSQSAQYEAEPKSPYCQISPSQFCLEYIGQHSIENPFEEIYQYDMILAKPYYFNKSVKEFFSTSHPKLYLLLLQEILLEFHPDYRDEMAEVLGGNKMYLSTLFVMKKELFQEFNEWIFPMLFELEKRTDLSIHADTYQARMPAYLHERFFNIWLCKKMKNSPLIIMETSCLLSD